MGGDTDSVPKRDDRFHFESPSPDDRWLHWREVVCRDTYSVTPTAPPDLAGFSARIDVRDCGRFGLAEVASSERSRERSPTDIARDGADHVVLFQATRRLTVSDRNGREERLERGDMCVLSTARSFRFGAEEGIGFRSLIIPRAVISPWLAGGKLPGLRALRGASPFGAVLGAALDVAWAQVPRLGPPLGDGVLDSVSRLAALSWAATEDAASAAGDDGRRSRLAMVCRYVDANITTPGLTAARAAKALGLSTRQIHALFSGEQQSFAQYVAAGRLAACHAALGSLAFRQRSILDIALGHGFNSLATFYRAFRAAYGVAPGDLRPKV